MTIRYGLFGQIVGGTLAAAIQFAVMLYLLRRAPSRSAVHEPADAGPGFEVMTNKPDNPGA